MKDTGIAYICWLFGLHSLYLGRPLRWIAYIMTFGGLGIWCLVDLFRMQTLVDQANQRTRQRHANIVLNDVQMAVYGQEGGSDEG